MYSAAPNSHSTQLNPQHQVLRREPLVFCPTLTRATFLLHIGCAVQVKEDTGTMRVLYRKGPEGTPLHTLCLEGMINGPLATGGS